jgi:NAD-dependent dihydropyrimidine dehydrogenase PreA subunit
MSIWMTPLQVRDAYDVLTRQLAYPSSQTLRKILEIAMSPEEAQLLVEMPATVEVLAAKVKRDPNVVAKQIERMFFAGLIIELPEPDGSATYSPPQPYCIETASDHMMWAIGGNFVPKSGKITAQDLWDVLDGKHHQICDLWNKFFYEEWYRWQRPNELVHRTMAMLGGAEGLAHSFSVMPAIRALEKSEALGTEILHDWDLREFARRGEKGLYTRVCTCRTRAKGCDFPLWVCGAVFDGMPGRDVNAELAADRRGQLHKYSGEEWLEVMIIGEEDHMMVHMGDSWMNGCNCCRDCCNWIDPLSKYTEPWEGVHPGPYRAMVNNDVCEGCTKNCMPRCAFSVLKAVKDPSTGKVKPYIDPDKCVGCGQCVVGCKVEGAIKMELAEAAGAHVPEMGGRAKLPSMPGFKPDIPRKNR